MSDKQELIMLAGDLQRIVDKLLDCAKEGKESDDKDEDDKEYSAKPKHAMLGLMLSKKMGKS